ncbi:hydroxyacid-oxoacid transhydrogenase [Solirubrobacter soli]|uniref:hydroxyacid-oxoacid transhydrogenase n=1 Tax=Solirubrobacter soli TaxID=363832 RepID=UPI0004889712
MIAFESIFTLEATPIKFGPGAVADAGFEAARLGITRALVVTDPGIPWVESVCASLRASGISVVVFSESRVEPTLESLQAAADFALASDVDGFVSIGGGSAIDTAKVANLIVSWPAPLMSYVNAPVGDGLAVPGPLRPHLAIPTTCGTGSEATTVAVLDVPSLSVKSGISHRFLRPSQAIVDPSLAASLPSEVVASAGLDVICHAAESYLSLPYSSRPAAASPSARPPYQGANPVADVWSSTALEYGGRYLRRAVSGDVEARGWMMLAASMAGVGFGSAGVHIPHACAYPIAGLRHLYVPPGYPSDHPFVPHGISVIVTAPAAFRFTFPASPSRHEHVAALLGAPGSGPDALPSALSSLMADLGVPSLSDLGYGEEDIPALVRGARAQERLLVGSPRPVTDDDLSAILRESLHA